MEKEKDLWDELIEDSDEGVESEETEPDKDEIIHTEIMEDLGDQVANPGDFVEIDFEDYSVSSIRGKVVGMYNNQAVPEVDDMVVGTTQDPALKIEIYSNENGEWKPTGKFIGLKMSQLRRTPDYYR